MKKIYFLIAAVLVLGATGYAVYNSVVQPVLDDRTIDRVVTMPIRNEALSFGFSFPSGTEGYTLIEPPIATSSTAIRAAYIMMNTKDYQTYSAGETTETPPTISIFVAPAPSSEGVTGGRVARLQQWAVDHPQYSSFSQSTSEVAVTDVDGATAIHYQAAGLYAQDVYIAFYDGNVYSFIGQAAADNEQMQADFDALIASVLFN